MSLVKRTQLPGQAGVSARNPELSVVQMGVEGFGVHLLLLFLFFSVSVSGIWLGREPSSQVLLSGLCQHGVDG